jgi:glutathionylspermidine synthase
MQRIPCPERDDWRTTAEGMGFTFHTIDGEPYWDERAYYGFTLSEIAADRDAYRRDRGDVPRPGRPGDQG